MSRDIVGQVQAWSFNRIIIIVLLAPFYRVQTSTIHLLFLSTRVVESLHFLEASKKLCVPILRIFTVKWQHPKTYLVWPQPSRLVRLPWIRLRGSKCCAKRRHGVSGIHPGHRNSS